MDADDRMIANVVVARGRRLSSMALAMAAGAALMSVVPHSGAALPVQVYGICSVLPVALGLAAVAGAITGLRTFSGHPPGVAEALRARGSAAPKLLAMIAVGLGILAALSGLLSLLWMQPSA